MGRSRHEAGPTLEAEPGRSKGGARSCGAAGLGPPRTSLSYRLHLLGRDMHTDWLMLFRGGLHWFAVLSARQAVPGRRCPPEPQQTAADGPGRAGTQARENRGACAAARPGRGSGSWNHGPQALRTAGSLWP